MFIIELEIGNNILNNQFTHQLKAIIFYKVNYLYYSSKKLVNIFLTWNDESFQMIEVYIPRCFLLSQSKRFYVSTVKYILFNEILF